jgi:phosphoserine aminotransferase
MPERSFPRNLMKHNALNFSSDPGALPATVLNETRDAIVALPGSGCSVLGMSHRSEWFLGILCEAEQDIRALLGLPDRYAISFLQGGAAMQRINDVKTQRLYGTFDAMRDAITVHAASPWRSRMNATFTFGDERLDRAFIARACEHRIVGLEGHRSLGGLRASLYNAVTPGAVETVCEAPIEFGLRHA